ncbi:hypothetical protein GS421_08195 [Rhodococcus hoagii]|nr:hypothetical protein [Prescottella equi]
MTKNYLARCRGDWPSVRSSRRLATSAGDSHRAPHLTAALKTRRAGGEQLAAQEGETEARKRKRLERQPEDFPDPDGPEDGA